MGFFEDLFANATTSHPVTLSSIIFYWDCQERITPTIEELNSELSSLFARGLICEIEPGKYINRKCEKGSITLTPISEVMYMKAKSECHSWHEAAREK